MLIAGEGAVTLQGSRSVNKFFCLFYFLFYIFLFLVKCAAKLR